MVSCRHPSFSPAWTFENKESTQECTVLAQEARAEVVKQRFHKVTQSARMLQNTDVTDCNLVGLYRFLLIFDHFYLEDVQNHLGPAS